MHDFVSSAKAWQDFLFSHLPNSLNNKMVRRKTTSLLRSRSKRCVTAQILTNTAKRKQGKRKQGKRKTETRKLLCRQRSPFQFCCQIFDLIALKTRSDGSTAIRTAKPRTITLPVSIICMLCSLEIQINHAGSSVWYLIS